ncbi:hypothetical protein M569_17114 [Genlisea aurea]|uniref:Uncharacterized protein n=1 Tax=Genlisea aurea TaxID=192259 RepID=S8D4T3_9LAMI|nr:hypothetical protein M569_17114 [Genlisea aurea]
MDGDDHQHQHLNGSFTLRQTSSGIRFGSSRVWGNAGADAFSTSAREVYEDDDEEALKWAALEKLPTRVRATRGIYAAGGEGGDVREVEIRNLGIVERRKLVDRLVKNTGEEDNERFLFKFKDRLHR